MIQKKCTSTDNASRTINIALFPRRTTARILPLAAPASATVYQRRIPCRTPHSRFFDKRTMANKYNITAKETWPTRYSHLNGTPEELLDRFAVSELCRAWPVYRDASEWQNYRDAWADKGSFLWTSECSDIPQQPRLMSRKPGAAASTSMTSSRFRRKAETLATSSCIARTEHVRPACHCTSCRPGLNMLTWPPWDI